MPRAELVEVELEGRSICRILSVCVYVYMCTV